MVDPLRITAEAETRELRIEIIQETAFPIVEQEERIAGIKYLPTVQEEEIILNIQIVQDQIATETIIIRDRDLTPGQEGHPVRITVPDPEVKVHLPGIILQGRALEVPVTPGVITVAEADLPAPETEVTDPEAAVGLTAVVDLVVEADPAEADLHPEAVVADDNYNLQEKSFIVLQVI